MLVLVRPGLGGQKGPGIPLWLAPARAVPTGYTEKKAPMFQEKCRARKESYLPYRAMLVYT
jgi:hypothetical protein